MIKVLVLACLCVTNCFLQQNKTENKSVAKVMLQYSSRCRKRTTGGRRSRYMRKQTWWDCPFTGTLFTRHASHDSRHHHHHRHHARNFFIFTVCIRLFDGLKDQRRRAFSALKYFFHVVRHAYSPQGSKKTYKTVKKIHWAKNKINEKEVHRWQLTFAGGCPPNVCKRPKQFDLELEIRSLVLWSGKI